MNAPRRLIVVGTDGSPCGDAALRWALRIAARPGDRVHAIEVRPAEALAFQPHGRRPAGHSLPHQRITAIRREFPDAPDVSIATPYGDPATELVTASTDADLLVVGTHGTGPARELLLGSVSRECVRYSRCPVAVITPEAARRLVPAAAEGKRAGGE
ncbi:universal stress protein [Amycolatopsis sp. WGS_07]|uniref:universal stress protein n=1 Tax=Amycolatopsis sp. WGS_07 TaxID=3076764 RepID=UPI0038732ED1